MSGAVSSPPRAVQPEQGTSKQESPAPTARSAWWERSRNFVAGYGSGMALVIAGHPFDTVKVRLQNEGRSGRFRGPIHCLATTVRSEGLFRGLYKGVTPPLVATGIINSVLFGLQGVIVREISGQSPAEAAIGVVAGSAVLGGFIGSFIVAPVEGIKSRLQVQYTAGGTYRGPIDATKKVIARLGVRNGLYRGWAPTALCRMSNYAYFGSYEYIRRVLAERAGADGRLPLSLSVAAGGLAGFCYWSVCYPLDVIKSRIQCAPDTNPPLYSGMRAAARDIYAKDGLRGFFNGLAPCVMRAFPANAAAFVMFEFLLRALP